MALDIERISPTSLRVTRRFAAPPARVFAAHSDPALLRRWMLGPDGWSMTECEPGQAPGDAIRFRWANDADAGQTFGLTGELIAVEPPDATGRARVVHVERMHLPDPTPDNRVETLFEPDGDGTRLTMTMSVDAPETMEAMIAAGMTDGMETSYARLDRLQGV